MKPFLTFCASFIPVTGFATLQPASVFSDHAVLQRDQPVPVWGTADPGASVSVSYGNFGGTATADRQGNWKVVLDPMSAAPGGELMIRTGSETFRARDVAVGDVWICAGQSNMEWPVSTSDDFGKAKANGNQPWLRELKIPRRPAEKKQTGFQATWRVCTPESVGTFSAVAYQYAAHLYPQGDIPVGILNVSFGGTQIEAWMSPKALAEAPAGPAVLQRWAEAAATYPELQARYDKEFPEWKARRENALAKGGKFRDRPPVKPLGRPGHFTQLSALYYGMLAPVEGYPARGVVWYQGESNTLRPEEYKGLLTSFIRDFRFRWQSPELPFFIVQLPLFDEKKLKGHPWAAIREAQSYVAEQMEQTYLAVIVDLGDERDKHPRNKTEVGRRLSLLARQGIFGENIAAIAPKPKSVAFLPSGSVEVRFETQGAELELRKRGTTKALKAFELAGKDGVFHDAEATLKDPQTVIISAASVPAPTSVRYLQSDYPDVILFSKDGVPARPFIHVTEP